MVFVVYPANAAHVIDSGFIVQMANQGVAGIGGHCQHTALTEQGHGLFQQTRLRIVRMNLQPLGHG
jgi:hypothetical protein